MHKIYTSRVYSCLSTFLVLCGISAYAADADRVSSILEAQATYFQRIESLKFDATLSAEIAGGQPKTAKYSYAYKGKMFRLSKEQLHADNPAAVTETLDAYDQKLYQTKRGHGLDISRSLPDRNPEASGNPLFLTRGFALPITGDTTTLDKMRDPQFWLRAAQKAQGVQRGRWGDYDCEIVTFIGDNNPTIDKMMYRVYFAPKYGYFPVRMECSGNVRSDGTPFRSEINVADIRQLPDGQGDSLAIPMRIVITDFVKDKVRQTVTFAISGTTLELNSAIEDALFTIPIEEDMHVFDKDLGVFIKSGDNPLSPGTQREIIDDVLKNISMQPVIDSTSVKAPSSDNVQSSVHTSASPSRRWLPTAIFITVGIVMIVGGIVLIFKLKSRQHSTNR